MHPCFKPLTLIEACIKITKIVSRIFDNVVLILKLMLSDSRIPHAENYPSEENIAEKVMKLFSAKFGYFL